MVTVDDNEDRPHAARYVANTVKLVMTLRTRDQADIVDAVVSFHLNAGVDFVIATDHRSNDGTVEILESYARDGVLRLIREEGAEVRGSQWRTRMARMAVSEYGADWTFSCDGDEFWWPRGPTLKEVLSATPEPFGIVFGLVRPFVPLTESAAFFAERMVVRLSPSAPLNSPLSPFRPYQKVAHRADPTVVVQRGNHALVESRLKPLSHWYPIEVLHFPIRTAEQAEQKYLAWSRIFGEQAMGTHRRVALLEQQGRLEEHFTSYSVADDVVRRGIESGVFVVDGRLRDVLRALSRSERGRRGFALPSELCTPMAFAPSTGEDTASMTRDRLSVVDTTVLRLRRRLDLLERRVVSVERGRR